MLDFVVDESRFIIDDEEDVIWFEEGFVLPDGIEFTEKQDGTDAWQLYYSRDLNYQILAVKKEIGDKWLAAGLLPCYALQPIQKDGGEFYLLISKSELRLERVTQVRFKGSVRYALTFCASVRHTRLKDPLSNLRDGIYCEHYAVVLPMYTMVPKLNDRTLFNNANRTATEPEILFDDPKLPGGISDALLKEILMKSGSDAADFDPWLYSGEAIEEFLPGQLKGQITGALVMRRHYQIYDTTCGVYLMLADKLWADALMHTSLVDRISFNPLNLDGKISYTLTFSKKYALGKFSDLHYGLTAQGAIKLAQALKRTRSLVAEADLASALYVEEAGLLFPENFTGYGDQQNRNLLLPVLQQGPFAMAPLSQELIDDCLLISDK